MTKKIDLGGFAPQAKQNTIDAFLHAGDPAPEPEPKKTERRERLVVYVPRDLATTLRVRCAEQRQSLSDATTEALERWASE